MLQHSFAFDAIGTPWRIETDEEIDQPLRQRILDRVEAFDKTYSRFRSDSLVASIANKAGSYKFPNDAVVLFDFYKKLYDITGGKVTPLVGDMVANAGYDANYSFTPKSQTEIAAWEDVLRIEAATITNSKPVTLDFGAAGKGYLVDLIAVILNEHSIHNYVVDASGDLRHKGSFENKVGLENPLDTTKVIGVVDVQNKSLCASASNRRAWGNGMHHIFDPETKAPVRGVIATWVIAVDAMVADGLATALFLSEPNELKSIANFEYVRMFKDGGVEYSPYFADALF